MSVRRIAMTSVTVFALMAPKDTTPQSLVASFRYDHVYVVNAADATRAR